MGQQLTLAGTLVGTGYPPYVIAEIGANHNGDMGLAREMIDAAVESGADAVKFQSWAADTLISKPLFARLPGLHEQAEKYALSREDHLKLRDYCIQKGITFFSTPFSFSEADMLETMDIPFFKAASMDTIHLGFLRYLAAKQRPIILSTGMSTLGEVEKAVDVIRAEGNEQLALLHCVAVYPPEIQTVNLHNLRMLAEQFDVPVGFSDHTIGIGSAIAAIALGASIIEKHFTLDKTLEGWDHAVSADPVEMAQIVREGRAVQQALGSSRRVIGEAEQAMASGMRRSVILNRSMRAGETVTLDDLEYKRPGTGIRPDEVDRVLGRKLAVDVSEEELLTWQDFA
jgi:N,N'-diacetyllegionaminate synthase